MKLKIHVNIAVLSIYFWTSFIVTGKIGASWSLVGAKAVQLLNLDIVIREEGPHLLVWWQCTLSTGADSNPLQLLVWSVVRESESIYSNLWLIYTATICNMEQNSRFAGQFSYQSVGTKHKVSSASSPGNMTTNILDGSKYTFFITEATNTLCSPSPELQMYGTGPKRLIAMFH